MYVHAHICTGWGKSSFTVVHMVNNTIINKYYKNKLFSHIHACKSLAHTVGVYICMFMCVLILEDNPIIW